MAELERQLTAPDYDRDALAAAVERAAGGDGRGARVTALDVLPGGHSGLTHVTTVAGPDGDVRAVVKSTPPGRAPRGRHDVLRQARILRALGERGEVAVPALLFAAERPIPLFGMGFVDGFATEPVLDEPRPGETAPAVRRAWRGAVDLLVALQRPTPGQLGLDREPATAPAADLDRWTATLRAGGLDADPRAARLLAALAAAPPSPTAPALVHGDFRLGNIMQGDSGEPAALVDWEIWSVGDRRSDLGWLTVYTEPASFPGIGRAAPGTPSADEVVERYLTATGTTADGIDWFRALACFKLAGVLAHNLRRHREGRHHDPHQERLADSPPALLERGLELVGG